MKGEINEIKNKFIMSLFLFFFGRGIDISNSNINIVFLCKHCKEKIKIKIGDYKNFEDDSMFKCSNCNSIEILNDIEFYSEFEEDFIICDKFNKLISDVKAIYQEKKDSVEDLNKSITEYINSNLFDNERT